MPHLLRAIVTSVILASSAQAGVVINEIMYRPGTTVPFTVENTGTEFIELHNTDASSVDISGWAFTSGVSFTIPAGTQIPAGGFVVVASNPAALQGRYGFADALGPWVAGGTLSNNSERVRLSKPGVNPSSFDRVDEVTYSSEGDWSPRLRETTFNGYDWSSPASVGGRSIELRNPALSNDNGQNWTSSVAGAGATPGSANSVLTANIPPIIKSVKHFPAVPKTTDPIRVTCELNDETAPAGLTATLRWRDSTSANPGVFATLGMLNDGSGKFSVTLPAQTTNLAILEFYIEARDGANLRTFPAPVGAEGQVANCNIQINNEVRTSTDTYYDLVLSGGESAAFNATQASDTAGNKIDRQFNITFISSRAGETSIRYRSSVRFRGNSSRDYRVNSVPFKPLRISIPSDDKLDGLTDFAINPRTSFAQHLGNRVLQACGLQVPDSIPIELRRNGLELANNSTGVSGTPDHGKWCRIEEFNGDFSNNHFPEATGGNLYKKGRPDEFWRTLGSVPSNPDGLLDGWSKQNNSAANNWTDLTSFFAVAQAVTAPYFTGAPAGDVNAGTWNNGAMSAAELTQLGTVADLDQWARWFAAMTILQDGETNISNGQDDDYAIYFAPNALGQRRLYLVAHDLDTIFGLGDPSPALVFNSRGLYDMTAEGSIFKTLLPLIGNSISSGNSEFRLKYQTALRELLGTVFEQTNFDAMVNQHLTGWAPPSTIAGIKTFVSQRRAHLLDLLPDGVVGGATAGAITPPTATSSSTLAATPGTAIVIHEILAANEIAYANGATYPDVIELRNVSGGLVDLSGMTLSDDAALPAKYVIPAGTELDAGQFLIIHADLATVEPGLHAGFSLDQDGDSVLLFASAANGGALVDSVTFGVQIPDFSIGRTGGNLNTWALCTTSIGSANAIVGGLPSPALLKINEWGPNPDYLLSGDFLELFNPSGLPTPIGGMRVTDDIINYPSRHVFPPLSFIRGNGFLRLNARGSSASAGNSTDLGFSLNSSFGSITLLGANGTTVDSVPVIGQPRDTSMGRSPDGSATILRFSLPSNPPTPGASNITPPASVLSNLSFLRVTELLFRPNELEFVELQNIGNVTLDLSGVQFTTGISYTFDPGVTLLPGAYIVVCKDRTAFLAQYGNSVPLAAGVFTGTLDNAGESVAFQPVAPWNINVLNFSYRSDWFVDATNDHSYVSVSPATAAARDWSDKDSWRLSSMPLGTPGFQEPPFITSALSASADLNGAFSYQIAATGNPTSYDATGLPVGFQIHAATGIIDGSSNAGGVYNVTISATNSGGTGSAILVISVAVNGPPSFTKGADQSVSMDSGFRGVASWATAISPGPPSESAQSVVFSVSSDNPALFSAQPAVSTNGGLTFTPAEHASGTANVTVTAMDNGGTSGGGMDTSAPQVFTITVEPNKAPSFVKGGNRTSGNTIGSVTIVGWATAISPGAGESGQSVSFAVSNTNTALFSTQPSVSSIGTLTYTVAGVEGVATVSVTAMDDGGTGNGGSNSSAEQTFTITIIGVNDAPSFTVGPNISVRHNVGAHTVAGWATGISAGPPDESSQTVSFSCTNSQNNLFIAQPSISPSGVLTFTPHPINSGTATITATLQDSGGTLDGGVDTVTKQFTITTRAVNDPPSFTPISTQLFVGVRTVYGQQFTSAISAGPTDESAQTVSFVLSNSRPDLFSSAPALLPGGVLSFTAGTVSGTAVFTIKAKDNGGVDDGGVDESAPIAVTVRITSALEAIGNYYALVEPAGTTARTNENAGFTKITLAKSGAFSGAIVMGGQKFSLKGKATDTGVITFAGTGNNSIVLDRKVGADLILSLSIQIGDVPSFKATIKPAGVTSYAGFTATRSIYDGKTALVPTTLLDPLTDKGKHAAAFLALAAPNQGLSAARFPQGDGVGELVISKKGDVKMKGKLADGTSFSMASSLLAGDTIPLYVPLYGAKGSLSGVATVRSQSSSDVDGSGFFWSRPLIAKPFHDGWPAGINVDLLGAKILPKATPLFPVLTASDADGNAAVDLSDATLGIKSVNVDAKNKVAVITPATDKLKVSASASSGKWSGSFASPTTGKTVKFSGVILRKAGFATGYYLDGIPGGGVRLSPAP